MRDSCLHRQQSVQDRQRTISTPAGVGRESQKNLAMKQGGCARVSTY
ncbi:hypothetical protein QUB47_00910 [Microcoleus sp. AT9_B5]